MNKSVFMVIGVLVATILACGGGSGGGFSFSTANISDAYLATDENGDDPTTLFEQGDTFYAIVEVANAPDDTTTKAEWFAVEADGVDPEFLIGEKVLQGGGNLNFSLSNDQLWPVGSYRVDIYLNDELDRSLEFEVEGDVAAVTEEEPLPEEEPVVEEVEETAPENQTGDTLGGSAGAGDADLPEGVIFAEFFDSDSNGWQTGEFDKDSYTNSVVIDDGVFSLAVEAEGTAYVEEYLPGELFSDFVLSVEATPLDQAEHYAYGLAFRVDASTGNGYSFEVANDGLYSVSVYDGEWRSLVEWTASEAIKSGQTNELAVAAVDNSLQFFVNDELLASVEDDTVLAGEVGLLIDIFEENQSATVEFDNLVVVDPAFVDLDQVASPNQPVSNVTAPTIVFQDEPYEHPSGAFSFRIPEGWEISTEDDTSAILGIEQPYFALVGSAFVDAGFIHTRASFQEFIDDFSDSFISTFGDTYEIVDQVGDPNDMIFLSATFDGEDGPGNIDLLFMQRKTVVYVVYFITDSHEELVDTRDEILASYEVDPDAAIAIAPAPAPPTATPRPAPAGPSAPAGKAVFLFRNNTSVDFVIDVIGPTNTSQVIPPNSSHEFVLDPGDYIINGHSPGGDYYIDAYNFSVGVGQVFPLDLN